MFKLSKRSLKNLKGVDDDLVNIVKRAIEITEIDFGVTEGLRSLSRQKQLLAKGATTTLNSRHLTGEAVDVVAYIGTKISWNFALYEKIADAMKKAANELGVEIEWGGDWVTFKDGPHFQLKNRKS